MAFRLVVRLLLDFARYAYFAAVNHQTNRHRYCTSVACAVTAEQLSVEKYATVEQLQNPWGGLIVQMQLSCAGAPSSQDRCILQKSCCNRKRKDVCVGTHLAGTRLQSSTCCCERKRTQTEQ